MARRVNEQLAADTKQQRVMTTGRFALQNDLGSKTPSAALSMSDRSERFPEPDVLEASGVQIEDLAPQLTNRVIQSAERPMPFQRRQ